MSSRTGKKISDLYFGVCYWDFNKKRLETVNLFSLPKVQRDVAFYVIDKDARFDPLLRCFHSVWGRCQFEMMVDGFPESGHRQKVDLYDLYVRPNRDHLLDLVSQVSEYQAKKWIREYNKKYNIKYNV